ncbi:MAG TPA: HAD hydrolase-like protein [Noviherbaspirillum sp.]|nr:HAD hydrolase-like protein [Noviherbaspirillum sp.]
MGIEVLALALDGVIFDTEDAHLASCNAAFENCGLDLRWSMQQFREAARVWGPNNALAAVVGKISPPASPRDVARLLQEKQRRFRELVLAAPPALHAGCMQLMEDAVDSGCKLAIVTDMPAQTATALLDRAFGDALTNMFAVVVSGADFDASSGNGPYHLALRTVGADAAQCAAIDGSVAALRAAQQAGLWTVASTPYEKDIARISGADLWCPNLQELHNLAGRRNASCEAADFVTFAALKTRKQNRLPVMPVSRQPQPLRAAA